MNENTLRDIKLKLSYTEDELYIDIASDISENELSINLQDISLQIEIAKTYLDNKSFLLREVICRNEKILDFAKKENTENDAMLVIAIADIISSIVIGISPVTVSTLIVKKGLSKYCLQYLTES